MMNEAQTRILSHSVMCKGSNEDELLRNGFPGAPQCLAAAVVVAAALM